MRIVWKTVKFALITIGGLAVLFVALGLSGALDKAPVPAPAAVPAPAPAPAVSAPKSTSTAHDENDPDHLAWYLVSKDSPHVIVWRDGASMGEGIRLIDDGTARKNPALMFPLIACFVDSGTQVADTSGGMLSSTVLVEEGPQAGCRGDVDNSFLTKKRPAPKNG